MQWAYWLGFTRVVLVGIDHRFRTSAHPNELLTAAEFDHDHFTPHYFSSGVRWQAPDLETSEIAYKQALKTYHRAGREILDCTVNGALNIFPKASLQEVLTR